MQFEQLRSVFNEAEGVLFYPVPLPDTFIFATWRRGEIKFYWQDGRPIGDAEEDYGASTFAEFQRLANQAFRRLHVYFLMEKAHHHIEQEEFDFAAAALEDAYQKHPMLFAAHVEAHSSLFAPHTETLKPLVEAIDPDLWDVFIQSVGEK